MQRTNGGGRCKGYASELPSILKLRPLAALPRPTSQSLAAALQATGLQNALGDARLAA